MLLFCIYFILARVTGTEIRTFTDIVGFIERNLTIPIIILFVLLSFAFYLLCNYLLNSQEPKKAMEFTFKFFGTLQVIPSLIFITLFLFRGEIHINASWNKRLLLILLILPFIYMIINIIISSIKYGKHRIIYGILYSFYIDALSILIECLLVIVIEMLALIFLGPLVLLYYATDSDKRY